MIETQTTCLALIDSSRYGALLEGSLRSPDVAPFHLFLPQQGQHTWLALAQTAATRTYAPHAYAVLGVQQHARGLGVAIGHAYDSVYPSGGHDTCSEPKAQARQRD